MSRAGVKGRKPMMRGFNVLVEALSTKWPELLALTNDTNQVSTQSSAFKKGLKELRDIPGDPLYQMYCELKPISAEKVKAAPQKKEAGPATRAKRRRTVAPHTRRVHHAESPSASQSESHSEIQSPTPSVSPEPRPQAPQLARSNPDASSILDEVSGMLADVYDRWGQVVQLTRQVTADDVTLRDKNEKLQLAYDALQAQHQSFVAAEGLRATQAAQALKAAEQRAALLSRRVAQLEATLKMCATRFDEERPDSIDPLSLRAFLNSAQFYVLKTGERALVSEVYNRYRQFTRLNGLNFKPSVDEFTHVFQSTFNLEVHYCDNETSGWNVQPAGLYLMDLAATIPDPDSPRKN